MEKPYSISVTLPPLGGIVLRPQPLPEAPPIEAEAEVVEVTEIAGTAAGTRTATAPASAADAKPALAQPE